MYQQNKNTRLLIVFGNLGLGGVQSKIVSVSKYLDRKTPGTRTHIILRDKPNFRLDGKLKKTHITIHYKPSWSLGFIHVPFTLFFLWKTIVLRPRVILTYYDVLSSFSVIFSRLLFWRRIRVVLNEDTLPSAHVASNVRRWLIRTLYPHADQIIVPTRFAKADLVKRFGITDTIIRVIPNWTDMRWPHTSANQVKKHYDLLYMGRFEKQKNLFFLLNAIVMIKKSHPNIKVLMVGEGIEKQRLLTFIRNHAFGKNVVIKKAVHSVPDVLPKTKMFVLTSYYEGMSVAVLEAMAAGVPVVVLWHPGIEEYIIHGKTGLVAKNQREFVSAVRLVLGNSSMAYVLARNAKEAVRANFSDQPLRRYIAVLLQDR